MKITYDLALDPGADIFGKFANKRAVLPVMWSSTAMAASFISPACMTSRSLLYG